MNKLCIAMAAVLLLTAVGYAQSEVTVVDQAGYTVTTSQPVESIASVYGIGTYFVYTLGAGDRLISAYYVGVKSAASAPATMQRWEPRLAELLSFGDPNVEELVASGAQLVMADGTQHEAVAAQLRDLGIPVVLYSAETSTALKDAMRLTGRILGTDAEILAEQFIADYDRVVETVGNDLTDLAPASRVRVLFLGTSTSKAASGDMYQTSLIEAAGGVSVTADLPGGWNEVNLEQILRWDPDVILIPPYGPVQPSDILENTDWQSLHAVQSGRVFRMPRLIAPMDTPVPESLLGIVWMASVFYPDVVTLDMSQEAARFYRDFYQLELTDEELAVFVGE